MTAKILESFLAFPNLSMVFLIAVSLLTATPVQVSVLTALIWLPNLLGLFLATTFAPALLAPALLAVLVVIGALAAPNLLGAGGDQNAGSDNSGRSNAQGGGNKRQSDGGSGENRGSYTDQQSATSSASASASATSGQSGLTARAAEQTVGDFYTSSSAGKYAKSARLLSEDYRQSTFPDEATFEGTFDQVERVVFIEGPNANISGNVATVTGETQATLTREIQHNKGTWYLVQEDGRWKIDGWDVVQLSSRSA